MEKTKRYFTQRELEKHINARLIRERKKNQDLETLKTMVDTLLGEGRINANSYAEAAEKLMAMIAGDAVGNKEEKERENSDYSGIMKSFGDTDADTSSVSNDSGEDVVSTQEDYVSDKSPDNEKSNADSCAEAMKGLMAIIARDVVGNKEEEKTETEESDGISEIIRSTDIKKFAGNNEDPEAEQDNVAVEDDIADGKGINSESKDIRERETHTAEIRLKDGCAENADITADAPESASEEKENSYDSERLVGLLRELIGVLEGKPTLENKADNGFFARRDICSTGFSKTGSGEDMRLAQTLTPTQREIARRAGLSYREYAGLLCEIPENTRKRKQIR